MVTCLFGGGQGGHVGRVADGQLLVALFAEFGDIESDIGGKATLAW